MAEIIHPKESYEIQGACFEVYKDKGCGYLEEVYHECLKIEFALRGIPFRSKEPMPLTYKGSDAEYGLQTRLHLLRQDHSGNQSRHFTGKHLPGQGSTLSAFIRIPTRTARQLPPLP